MLCVFLVSLELFVVVFLDFIVFSFQYQAEQLARKNFSDMTYFVSMGRKTFRQCGTE